MRGSKRQGTRANKRQVQAIGLSPIRLGVIERGWERVFGVGNECRVLGLSLWTWK